LSGGFTKAKCYDDMNNAAGDWSRGKAEFEDVFRAIAAHPQRIPRPTPITIVTAEDSTLASNTLDTVELSEEFKVQGETPKEWRPNPHLDEVLKMSNILMNPARIPIPAAVSDRDSPTPTLSPLIA